jgi:hypothetical protein
MMSPSGIQRLLEEIAVADEAEATALLERWNVVQARIQVAYRLRWFTPAEDQIIRKDYAAYVPTIEIARKLKRDEGTVRGHIYTLGLSRSGLVSKALAWAPPHLRAQLGQIPDQAFLTECHRWRDQQRELKRAALNAAYDTRSRIVQEKCAEIDAGPDVGQREKMIAKRLAGATLQEVANQHGVTRERVRQVTTQPAMWEQARIKAKAKAKVKAKGKAKMQRLAAQHTVLVDREYRHLLKTWKLALPEAKARFLCALQPNAAPDHERPLNDVPAAAAEPVQSNDDSVTDSTANEEETSNAGRM